MLKQELKLEREGVFNQHIKPGTPFFAANKKRGVNMKRLLRGLEQHEGMGNGSARSGHTKIFRTVIKKDDPAKIIERMWAESRETLRKKADDEINRINKELAKQSEDPINLVNWKGRYYLHDAYAKKWCRDPVGDKF